MNIELILRVLGGLLVLLSVLMLIPISWGLLYPDAGMAPLLVTASFTLLAGFVLVFLTRDARPGLRKRSAFFLVSMAWFSVTIIGAVPFYLSGAAATIVDALFESASGFTTTGATIFADIESQPPSILLWRSLMQFIGGMGMIVFSLAILPILGIGGMELYRAEAPGPTSDKVGARASETARALWLIYFGFFAALLALLMVFGMNFFDAINHAFTTMATGGFSTKNGSVGHFQSSAIEWTITFFMLCAGTNFLLHYKFLIKRNFAFLKDNEFRFYLALIVVSTGLITFVLLGDQYSAFPDALRYAAFQVVSILSSTGYGTGDYLLWGSFVQILLLSLMVVGGCAGSTGGGIKCVRAMMLLKQGYRELYLLIHPRAVYPLKLGKNKVPTNVSGSIFGYFFLYIGIMGIATLMVTATGVDPITSLSATISSMSNIGPGLGAVGPASTYAPLPDAAKAVLSFCMIVGRLEIFTVIVLFLPEYWRA